MKLRIGAVALLIGIVLAILAWTIPSMAVDKAPSTENKGAAEMKLDGGSRGLVPFPHRLHQERLKDCQSCHATFPQTTGSIEALKAQEKLPPKQVMNKLCLSCHRAEKAKGATSGPTTCSKCHVRKRS